MAKKDFKIKGFSYHIVNDADAINYIEKQPNQSSYILELVRNDMNCGLNEIESLVKKYVKDMLKERNFEHSQYNNTKATKQDISQLLNIGKV